MKAFEASDAARRHAAPTIAPAPLSPNAWLRYDLTLRLLRSVAPRTSFLEVGCGVGGFATRLVNWFEYTGYEPDRASYEVAAKRLNGRGVVVHDRLPEHADRAFDIVGAFEVLEHIEDDRSAVRRWREWLVIGGHILISVPANPARFSDADRSVGHFRRYTRRDLDLLLTEAGFTITLWSYGFPLGYLLEYGRNLISRRISSVERGEATARSGRFYQPATGLGPITNLFTFPFRIMQRPFRHGDLGTGLLALARRCD